VRTNPIPATDAGLVVVGFMEAIVTGDRDLLHRVALPHPELDILLATNSAPSDVERAMRHIGELKLRELHVGDDFGMPNGDRIVVTESMVNEKRKLITHIGNPVPFHLVNDDGWKLDASPIIVIRKAASSLER